MRAIVVVLALSASLSANAGLGSLGWPGAVETHACKGEGRTVTVVNNSYNYRFVIDEGQAEAIPGSFKGIDTEKNVQLLDNKLVTMALPQDAANRLEDGATYESEITLKENGATKTIAMTCTYTNDIHLFRSKK